VDLGPDLVQKGPLAALRDDKMYAHVEPAQKIEDGKADSRTGGAGNGQNDVALLMKRCHV
jgi:hypothetical protein